MVGATRADGRGTARAMSEASETPSDQAAGGPADGGHRPALPDEELDRAVEALLFASGEPLSEGRIASLLDEPSPRRIRSSLERLRAEYTRSGRAFDVLRIGGGYRLYTRPEYEAYVARLDRKKGPERLTPAALETLAIVAYRQPISRAEIEGIRGVQCGPVLRALKERKLIRVVGRAEQPGRPPLYGTTRRFLDHFGLDSLRDLPSVEELKNA